jgi:hypothetical protein
MSHACVLVFAKRFGEARPECRTSACRHGMARIITPLCVPHLNGHFRCGSNERFGSRLVYGKAHFVFHAIYSMP